MSTIVRGTAPRPIRARRSPRRASSSGAGIDVTTAASSQGVSPWCRDPVLRSSGGLEAADRDQAPDLGSRLAVGESGFGLRTNDLAQEEQRPCLRVRHGLVEEALDHDRGLGVGERRIEGLLEFFTEESEVARLAETHRAAAVFRVALVVPCLETPRGTRSEERRVGKECRWR